MQKSEILGKLVTLIKMMIEGTRSVAKIDGQVSDEFKIRRGLWQAAKSTGLEINLQKTKFFRSSRQQIDPEKKNRLNVGGQQIEKVTRFKYLGS